MTLKKESPILIIDDSPAILALLRDLLKAHGYKSVHTADNVEEGVEVFQDVEPQVVFLDLMMPDQSGLEFVKQVLNENPKARIVITTALPPGHESVLMAISQGAVEYLQKPLRNDNVSLILDRLQRQDRAEVDVFYS